MPCVLCIGRSFGAIEAEMGEDIMGGGYIGCYLRDAYSAL